VQQYILTATDIFLRATSRRQMGSFMPCSLHPHWRIPCDPLARMVDGSQNQYGCG